MLVLSTRVSQKLPGWLKLLLNLLPLWLVCAATTAEGFPAPPISLTLASWLFFAALGLILVLALLRWMPFSVMIYSLLPVATMILFDDVSTGYKTPFMFACAGVLSIGVMLFLFLPGKPVVRYLALIAFAALGLFLASGLTREYWDFINLTGLDRCYPDCAPLPDAQHPWWSVFF